MPDALFIIPQGLEELEAVAPVDILRRAGISVTLAALGGPLAVTGRNGITLLADCTLDDAADKDYDAIVLPGGPGHTALKADTRVLDLLRAHDGKGRLVAAICAAPTVLEEAGVIRGRAHTAHFTVKDQLPDMDATQAVVRDGNMITSQGAGTAVEFGLALVTALCGQGKADAIAASICKPA